MAGEIAELLMWFEARDEDGSKVPGVLGGRYLLTMDNIETHGLSTETVADIFAETARETIRYALEEDK